MNVVDSSGWLEYFADAENAASFESAIEDADQLVVPSINLSEVFKPICQQRGEGVALQAIAQMQQGQVVELTSALALSTARLSTKEHLPMADSVNLATARAFRAVLWTQDKDFASLHNHRRQRWFDAPSGATKSPR